MIAGSLKGKVLVFAVFFLGLITGALVTNVYVTRLSTQAPEEGGRRRAQQDVEALFDYLGLSAEQRQQWNDITQESKPEYDKLWDENRQLTAPNRAKFDALGERTRERLRLILNEEQKKKYNDFRERDRMRRQSQPGRKP